MNNKVVKRPNRNKKPKNSEPAFSTKSLMVAVSISIGTASSAAMIFNGGPGAAEGTITVGLQAVFKAIKEQAAGVKAAFDAQMAAMDLAVAGAFLTEKEQVNSGMRVLVKQMSVSSNLLAENAVQNAQNEAAVEQARLQKDRIIETNERLGPAGQGHKVCTVLMERMDVAKVSTSNSKEVPSLVSSTVYAAPGAYGNPHEVQTKMNAEHSDKYCTPEQAASGYCAKASDEAGWDLMTSTLFTPTTTGSSVYDAQNALINNMVGLPDAPIPESLKGSPTASNYLTLKQKKDAIVSPAINSLKTIQTEFAGMETSDSGSQVSPIKAIDEQVKRYLGSGEEYQSWNQTLTSASEEGVMKEILQVQALDLHLLMRQYKQGEREEMLVAGIVSATQQLIDKANGKKSGYVDKTQGERAKLAARETRNAFELKLLGY